MPHSINHGDAYLAYSTKSGASPALLPVLLKLLRALKDPPLASTKRERATRSAARPNRHPGRMRTLRCSERGAWSAPPSPLGSRRARRARGRRPLGRCRGPVRHVGRGLEAENSGFQSRGPSRHAILGVRSSMVWRARVKEPDWGVVPSASEQEAPLRSPPTSRAGFSFLATRPRAARTLARLGLSTIGGRLDLADQNAWWRIVADCACQDIGNPMPSPFGPSPYPPSASFPYQSMLTNPTEKLNPPVTTFSSSGLNSLVFVVMSPSCLALTVIRHRHDAASHSLRPL
jgi:hypothetical protein